MIIPFSPSRIAFELVHLDIYPTIMDGKAGLSKVVI
jgi:hypothetical protein